MVWLLVFGLLSLMPFRLEMPSSSVSERPLDSRICRLPSTLKHIRDIYRRFLRFLRGDSFYWCISSSQLTFSVLEASIPERHPIPESSFQRFLVSQNQHLAAVCS